VEEHVDLKDQIQRVLDRNRFAVLATQHAGQPHASLMAFTPMSGVRYLVFATYRGTLKHRNLLEDRRVAVLIDDGDAGGTHPNRRRVLTALGDAIEIPDEERQAAVSDHLARHPDLEEFVRSPDCALVRVAVRAYQVVGGIDDVQWYHIEDPAAT
jgi:nitroimidazol reductase NimA-like FMN-containing flavoprotein (pyridoxamine 5'-phosphate oxidase superfamily)